MLLSVYIHTHSYLDWKTEKQYFLNLVRKKCSLHHYIGWCKYYEMSDLLFGFKTLDDIEFV